MMTGTSGRGPQAPAHLEPVEAGQHQVEHDEVGGRQPRTPTAPTTRRRRCDGVQARPFEVGDHHLGNRGVVVDDEEPSPSPELGACLGGEVVLRRLLTASGYVVRGREQAAAERQRPATGQTKSAAGTRVMVMCPAARAACTASSDVSRYGAVVPGHDVHGPSATVVVVAGGHCGHGQLSGHATDDG